MSTPDEPRSNLVRDRLFVAGAFVLGTAFAALLTGPRMLALINWDNGSFLAELSMGKLEPPWNAHFAGKDFYRVGIAIARLWGGTFADGFRVTTALGLGCNAAIVAYVTRRLCASRVLAALLTLAWMTSWVIVFLLLTLEDNILFLAPTAGVMGVVVLRAHDLRLRDAAAAGALAGLGVLLSWQALVYLAPAFYVACFAGGLGRDLRARLGRMAALFGSFLGALIVWPLLNAAVYGFSAWRMLALMFSRPQPSYLPHSLADLGHVLGDVHGFVRTLGLATYFQTGHAIKVAPWWSRALVPLGAFELAVQLAIFGGATLLAWRARRWALHVVVATLLLFSLVTSLYHDVDYAELKRYDFVPLMLVLVAAELLRLMGPSRRARVAVGAALALVIVGQSALALRWDRATLRGYPLLPETQRPQTEPYWYGRAGHSWYAYFSGERRAHPSACRFVFTLDELAAGRWNHDVMGSLWSELPNHEAIAPAGAAAKWRYPPRVVVEPAAAAAYLNDGCSVLSPDARLVLGAKR